MPSRSRSAIHAGAALLLLASARAHVAHAQAQPLRGDELFTVESGCGRAAPAAPAASASPVADARPPRDSSARTAADSGTRHALVLRAAVSAREVRFRGQPSVVVRLCGATGDSVRVVERRNLPKPVVAGTTYRDVYVAVEILGHIDANCIAGRLTGAPADTTSRCAALTTTRSPDR